jgi:hypothetical protein
MRIRHPKDKVKTAAAATRFSRYGPANTVDDGKLLNGMARSRTNGEQLRLAIPTVWGKVAER